MVKLGEFNRGKKKVSFTEWIKEGKKKEGIYRIKILFPPSKYQSYTAIFESEEYEVRLSIKAEKFREAMKALGISIGRRNIPSLILIVDKDSYGLDFDEKALNVLEWKGTYWKYEDAPDDDSITF